MLPLEIENRREEIRLEIEKLGTELLDISVRRSGGRNAMVITADKAGGISLGDCALINSRLSHYFDEFPGQGSFFNGPYTLEVNSPGLDRPLKTEKDFLRAAVQVVRVAYKAEHGAGLVLIGKVLGIEDSALKLELPKDGNIVSIALQSITKAGLEIKINK